MLNINYQKLEYGIVEGTYEIPYSKAHEVFMRLREISQPAFLFESKDISPIYGRLSLIGINPALRVSGKNNRFNINALHKRGKIYITADVNSCDVLSESDYSIRGEIRRAKNTFEETERSKQKNISLAIRSLLERFYLKKRSFLGLYGAFSYDFVRLFEDIDEKLPQNDVNDFDLFLFDTFVLFDHLKERAYVIVFRQTKREIEREIAGITEKINEKSPAMPSHGEAKQLTFCVSKTTLSPSYSIQNPKFSFSKDQYENLVKKAQEYMRQGEIFEVVFSNILNANFTGDPFGLYLIYREVNPSPYLYFFDFEDQQLVGASPEMMVRVENNLVHMRPISGTAVRGKDPIEDHENMVSLLTDKKERAELDMLVDLGRNDLSRVCKPGLKITDYRFVEKYSKVMHTVAHITGELKEGFTAFDALISCLNAGTLTGAPKFAAMNIIENHEKQRRGFYGGTIGYLTFSGEMDTAIIIRTAHIKNGKLRFQVGATLLFASDPKREYEETLNKARAFLSTLTPQTSI